MLDISKIPSGIYCYDETGVCPYWRKHPNKIEQESGYCLFLKKGDWMKDGTMLLWDAVKECGINSDDEELFLKLDNFFFSNS